MNPKNAIKVITTFILLTLTKLSFSQLPILNNISPTISNVGNQCIITGDNFGTNANKINVYFDNISATITAINNNSIFVKVPVGTGNCKVKVYNNGKKATRELNFTYKLNSPLTLNTNNISTDRPNNVYYNVNAEGFTVINVDLNGDAKPDKIIADQQFGYLIYDTIYKQYKRYNLDLATSKLGLTTGKIFTEDLNGDGQIDIAISHDADLGIASSAFTIFLNQLNTYNQTGVAFKKIQTELETVVALLDANRDGLLDYLMYDDGYLYLYHNTSKNKEHSYVYADRILNIGTINDIEVNDFNGDNKLDLFVKKTDSLHFYPNLSGQGIITKTSFSSKTSIATPLKLVFADMNNDEKNDLIYISSNTIYLRQNESVSGGSVIWGTPIQLISGHYSFLVADLNGDGKKDIFGENFWSNIDRGSIYENTYNGGLYSNTTFVQRKNFMNSSLTSFTVFDVNDDGILELGAFVSNKFNSHNFVLPIDSSSLDNTLSGKINNKKWISGRPAGVSIYSSQKPDNLNTYTLQISDEFGNFSNSIYSQTIPSDSTYIKFNFNVPLVTQEYQTFKIKVTRLSPFLEQIITDSLLIVPQQPNLTSVSNLGFGAIGETLTLNGTGFNTLDNKLYIGGKKAKILSVQPTQIIAEVPKGATTGYIIHQSVGVTKRLDIRFNYKFNGPKGNNLLKFDAPKLITSNKLPVINDVKLALDLNDDGNVDIPDIEEGINQTKYPLDQIKFKKIDNTINWENYNLHQDFDGDGIPDKIAYLNGIITVKNTPIAYTGSIRISADDLNNDGLCDLVVMQYGAHIKIYTNITRAGEDSIQFSAPIIYNVANSNNMTYIIADIDNDSKKDIIIGPLTPSSTSIELCKNTSTGNAISFAAPTGIGTSYQSLTGFSTADMNNDGYQDLLAISPILSNQGKIFVFMNNGVLAGGFSNTFSQPISIQIPPLFSTLTGYYTVDWDGDQNIDIYAFRGGIDSIYILRNTQVNGNFNATTIEQKNFALKNLTIAIPIDIDQNGSFDFINGYDEVYCLINNTPRFVFSSCNNRLIPSDSLKVYFKRDASANTIIQLQLSDSSGIFGTPNILASKSSAAITDSLFTVIPSNIVTNKNYKIRLVNTGNNSISDTVNLEITPAKPQVLSTSFQLISNDTLTITGSNLNEIIEVKFGLRKGVIVSKTANQLKVKLPFRSVCDYVYLTHSTGIIKSPNEVVNNYVKRTSTSQLPISGSTVNKKVSLNKIAKTLCDVNNDGFIDVIGTDNNILFAMLNNRDSVTLINYIEIGKLDQTISTVTKTDFDLDGDDDILCLSFNTIYLLENKSTINFIKFEKPRALIEREGAITFFCGNFTSKQEINFLVQTTQNYSTDFFVYQKTATYNTYDLEKIGQFGYPNRVMQAKITDLDNNGIDDILMSNSTGNEMRIFAIVSRTNKYSWLFDTISVGTTIPINEVYASDLDNDLKKDIISKSGTNLNFLKNNNVTGFSFQQLTNIGNISSSYLSSVNGINIIDLDFDGIKDIAVGGYVFRGKNTSPASLISNYFGAVETTTATGLTPLFGDLNNDNKTDVINANNCAIFTNVLQTIIISQPKEAFCIGNNATVTFSLSQITFDANNTFKLVLSDSNGNFNGSESQILATLSGINSGTFNFTVPSTLSANNLYKFRIESTQPAVISDNEITFPLIQCLGPIRVVPNVAQIGEQVKITGSGMGVPTEKIVVYFNKARAKVVLATDSVLTVVVPPNASYGMVSVSIEDYTSTTLLPFTVKSSAKNKFDSTCFGPTQEIGNLTVGYIDNNLIDADGDGYIEFFNKTYNYNPTLDSIKLEDTYFSNKLIYTNNVQLMLDLSGDGVPDFAAVNNTTNCGSPSYGTYFSLKTNYRQSKLNFLRERSTTLNNFTFQTNTCYSTNPSWLSGDFNLDGRNDVLALQSYGSPVVMIMRSETANKPFYKYNLPTQSIRSKQMTNTNTPENVYVCKGDFNLDGRLDFATYKSVWINRIDTVINKNDIMNGLNPALNINTLTTPRGIFSADLNNDNKIDFGIFDAQNKLRIYLNQSTTGNLSIAQDHFIIQLSSIHNEAILEDLTGDGKPELILGNTIYKNTSNANSITFDTVNKVVIKYNHPIVTYLRFFDMNGDGRLDAIGSTNQDKIIFIKNQFPVFGVKYPTNSFCFNDSLVVELNSLDYNFGIANNFTLQLSDSLGSFSNPTLLSNVTRVGNLFKSPMPPNVGSGKNFKIRIIASAPSDTSSLPQFGFEIKPSFNAPNLINITGINVACVSDSILLQSSSLNPLFGYKWTPTSDTIDRNSTTVIKYAKQTGLYQVQTTYDGCTTNSNSIQLTFNTNPISKFSLGINNKICSGDSILLIADTIANGSYRWYRNNSLLADTSSKIAIKDSGYYKLKLTNQNNCITFSRDTFVSKVNKPIVSVILNKPSSICSGDSINLSSSNINNNKFKWRLNGSVLSNDSLATLSVKASGNWGLQIIDANNCKSIWVDTLVTVNNNPVVSYTLNRSGTCEGDSVIITANSSGTNTFNWYRNLSLLNNDTINTLTVKNNGSYKVKAINSFGCTTLLNDTLISFNPKPLNTLSYTGNNKLCNKDSVMLSAPQVVGYKYNWFKNGIVLPNDTNNTLKVKNSGNYFVITQNQFGCINSSIDKQLTFNPLPIIKLTPLVNQAICNGDSVIVAAQTNTTTQVLNWYKNNQLLTSIANSILVKEQGYYYAIVVDSNLCKGYTDTISLIVKALPVAQIFHTTPTTFCSGDSVILNISNNQTNQVKWLYNGNIISNNITGLTARQTGQYAVIITDSLGCTSMPANINVTVNNLPIVTLLANNGVTFCQSDSSILSTTFNTSNKYQWYINNLLLVNDTLNNIVAKTSGLYTLKVKDLNRCEQKADTTITVNALPAKPLITKELNELVSSASNGNQWLLNKLLIPNATSKRITISQIGNYQVFVTDLNGCKSDTSSPFVYSSVAQIIDVENLINLYPIPANQNFSLSSTYPITELVINDWSGKVVLNKTIENSNEIINVANLASGVYAVKLLVTNVGWITKTISIVR
jgi:hypothetical protein